MHRDNAVEHRMTKEQADELVEIFEFKNVNRCPIAYRVTRNLQKNYSFEIFPDGKWCALTTDDLEMLRGFQEMSSQDQYQLEGEIERTALARLEKDLAEWQE